ncbi:MAG: hypothetical protein ACI4HI_17790 [Lachnospiraceae bacterium]
MSGLEKAVNATGTGTRIYLDIMEMPSQEIRTLERLVQAGVIRPVKNAAKEICKSVLEETSEDGAFPKIEFVKL